MKFSNKRPIDEAQRHYHLSVCREAARRLVEREADNKHEWRIISDIVNMCDTFVSHKGGQWKGVGDHGRTITLGDDDGLIAEAIGVMAKAGMRHIEEDVPINMTPEEGAVILDLLDVYEEIIGVLVESEVEKCRNIVRQYVKRVVHKYQRDGNVEGVR